jgi:hypothetical protein
MDSEIVIYRRPCMYVYEKVPFVVPFFEVAKKLCRPLNNVRTLIPIR